MDNFGMCGLLINGVPLDTYEGAALLDYSIGETSIKNETFQGINRSTWHLLKSIYGLRKITLTIVFTGPTRRAVTLQRSKLNGALFGASELYISDDGFFYDVTVESCGPEILVGEGEREVKIKSEYTFSGTRRDALVSETIPGGGKIFCKSTMPFTDARLKTVVGSTQPKTFTGSVVSFEKYPTNVLTGLSTSIVPVQSGTGNPSPDNIRPIVGASQTKIYVSPTQNAQDATVYTVDFNGTRYGGTLDVTSGKLTINKAAVGLETLTFQKYGNYPIYYAAVSGKKYGNENVISDMFFINAVAISNMSDGGMRGYSSNSNVYFRKDDCTTLAEWDAWVQANTTEVVYELETPIEVDLIETEVELLTGTNNIWSDTGDVTVTIGNEIPTPYPLGGAIFPSVSNGDVLVFDGIDGKITKNGANAAASVNWTEFPQLFPGENTIPCPDDVTVEYYPTYI